MDEVDLDIKNYDELFGAALDNTEQLFDNDEIDGLFGTKDMSVSNCQGAYAAEVILKMSHYLIYSVACDHCNLIVKKSFFLLLLLFWIAAEKPRLYRDPCISILHNDDRELWAKWRLEQKKSRWRVIVLRYLYHSCQIHLETKKC